MPDFRSDQIETYTSGSKDTVEQAYIIAKLEIASRGCPMNGMYIFNTDHLDWIALVYFQNSLSELTGRETHPWCIQKENYVLASVQEAQATLCSWVYPEIDSHWIS